jgi:hypothetical protein
MPRAADCPVEITPVVLVDVVSRLMELAQFAQWLSPRARGPVEGQFVALAGMRAAEAASVIVSLAEIARPLNGNGAATEIATQLSNTGQHEAVRAPGS